MYRRFKEESYTPPVTFLPKPDGATGAHEAQMDGLLQEA